MSIGYFVVNFPAQTLYPTFYMMLRPACLSLVPLVFMYFIFFSMQAQVQDSIVFQHIKNGMPQNSATVLFEDSYGFLWVGTPTGLNKYNGRNFELFENEQNSITNGYINTLYEAQTNLYVGTNQGLSFYDRGLNRIMPFSFKAPAKELESKNIRAIAKTDSLLWLGTNSYGLYKYNMETGAVKQFLVNEALVIDRRADNLILKILPLSGKRLLVVSSFKIFIMDHDLRVLNALASDEFLNVAVQSDADRFLIGTGKGTLLQLCVYPDSEFQIGKKSISPGFPILALARDADNTIWMGTENDGLYTYSDQQDSLQKFELDPSSPSTISSNSIWSLLKMRNNVMWMAPFKKGLSFYDPEYYKFKHITTQPLLKNTLSNALVNCFSEDTDGNLWIGTDGGGLDHWNRKTGVFENYSLGRGNFGSNVVLSLLPVQSNALWVGTWSNGMLIFDPQRKTYKKWDTTNSFLLSNNVSDLLQDSKGRIWILSLFGGVQVYDPRTGKHDNIVLRSDVDSAEINTVFRVMEDANGTIWIGTQTSGVLRLVENKDGWSTFHYHNTSQQRKLSNNFVNAIVQDVEGSVWVGTHNGLNKYDSKTDSFSFLTKTDGLSNNGIKAIMDGADGHLWLSTDAGITDYDKYTGETVKYTVSDGLQANEFNPGAVLMTGTGEFVFGGVNGFNIFSPGDIKKRTDVPELFISELRVFNVPVLPNDASGILQKDISMVDSVAFNYDHSVLNFRFNALTFRHPEAVSYAYFLDGFETDWKTMGNNPNATYTNLNPGAYTLRIKSTNSDGIWVDNEKQLQIYIKPPFWKTIWFRSLLTGFILLGIYWIYHLKVSRIQRTREQLEKLVVKRTKQLQNQKDKLAAVADELATKNEEIQRFTFAVSHDLKGPLNNIKSIADLIPNEVALNTSSNLKEYLRLIGVCYDIMDKLITDISEIARLGKIENKYELLDTNEIIGLASSMISGKLDMQKVKIEIEEDLPAIYGDRNRMIQVFGNFLDNAVKYMEGRKNPEIRISCQTNDDFNTFLIRDNGSGLNAQALNKIFTPFERFHSNVKGTGLGLYMIQQIAISHGGRISATSDGEGKGSVFHLILPKAAKASAR